MANDHVEPDYQHLLDNLQTRIAANRFAANQRQLTHRTQQQQRQLIQRWEAES